MTKRIIYGNNGFIATLTLLLTAIFLMGGECVYGANIDIYSYSMPGSALGGTVCFSSTPGATATSYKIDEGKYVCITLQDGVALKEGDIISITGSSSKSAGDAFKLKASTSSSLSVNTTTLTNKGPEALTYTVTANDILIGQSKFYIYRSNNSIYFHNISIARNEDNLVELVHTGSTYARSDKTLYMTCDAALEHYNNTGNRTNAWTGQAAMKFSFLIPAGKVIKSATLNWTTSIGGSSTTNRKNQLRCLKTGVDPDWDALADGTATAMLWSLQSDDDAIDNPLAGANTHDVENDVTTYIRNHEQQGYVVFMLSDSESGADLYGKTNSNESKRPKLTLTFANESDVNKVTYNANTYGTCATSYSIYDTDDATHITLPSVTPNSNRVFTGWYDAASGGNFVGDAGDSYTPTTSITLYAHYVEIQSTNDLIGSTDRRVGYGKSFSQYTKIQKGDTYSFTFNNYGSDGRNSVGNVEAWYNWTMLAVDATPTELFHSRADNYWWTSGSSGSGTFSATTGGNWTSYLNALKNGAEVTVKVTLANDGQHINTVATTVYDGITYTVTTESPAIAETNSVYICFTPENSYMDNYAVRKVSSDATVKEVIANDVVLKASDATYSYCIGKAYSSNNIDITITPNDAGAVVSTSSLTGASGESVIVTATIGTPLNFTITAGDNETTAKAIAKQANIDEVIAGVLPDGKAQVVENLKAQGKVVMVGDGINDAPALTSADIGMAIGAGTDVAVDAASVVLVKNRLSDVPAAIRLGLATLRTIHQNLFWAFIYNALLIPFAAGAFARLMGWSMDPMYGAAAMSLSSFCVVMNALRLNLKNIHSAKHDRPKRHRIFDKNKQNLSNCEYDSACPVALQEENDNEILKSTDDVAKENIDMKKVMHVEGMMCSHCEARVQKALEALAEVKEAKADHETGLVLVKLFNDVDDEQLKQAVEAQDYKVTGIETKKGLF